MARMTGPDCTVMCNLINTHTLTHTEVLVISIIDPPEWHKMTINRITGPDCAVMMCNSINAHTPHIRRISASGIERLG